MTPFFLFQKQVQNGHGRNSTDGPGPLSSMLSQADEVMEHASSQVSVLYLNGHLDHMTRDSLCCLLRLVHLPTLERLSYQVATSTTWLII